MEVDVLLVVEAEVNLEVAALCLNERDWELGDLCIFARLCLCADKDGDVSVEENAIEDWDEIAIIGLYSAVCCAITLGYRSHFPITVHILYTYEELLIFRLSGDGNDV